ncbi:MAG: MFS transporter [Candidatus Korobacteraceae bacterium]
MKETGSQGTVVTGNPTAANVEPTRARYWVVVFAVTLAILAYIDRVAISQAAIPISRDLGFSRSEMGAIFGAFALAYALFEIPSGWLGDWMGPRRVLIRIVIAWSAFTALTGAAWSLRSLWIIRFLFGAGEAGCFPNLTKAFSVWLPTHERVRAQGIMWSFARWGGAFTPPLVVLAFKFMSWRMAFASFGLLGLIWCFFFARWFRDRPTEHPSVNAGERELLKDVAHFGESHGDVPWKRLFTNRSVVLLWIQYWCFSYTWYFYITWLPTYLQDYHKLSAGTASLLAILPLLFGGFGSLSCGFATPHIARWLGSTRTAQRVISTAGMVMTAVLLVIVTGIQSPILAMLLMGLASYSNDLVMPIAWNACMDIGGKYAGTVSGSMNMMGNLGGFVAPWVGGILLDRTGNDWNLLIYLMAGVALLGAVCWVFIDPGASLEPDKAA